MDTAVEIFPFSAWEQAVFVVLFIIFVAGLLRWFSKQQEEWQDFINSQNDRWQKAISDQTLQWGLAVKDQNQQWQSWLKEQNDRECVTMDKVTVSLEKLTLEITKHDERSANRFLEAIRIARDINGEKKPKPGNDPGH